MKNGFEKKVAYLAADFSQDDLPTGFDMVVFCDSGPLSETLFHKIYGVLNPNGRLVLVGRFAPDKNHTAPSHLLWVFLISLEYPTQPINFTTSEMVQTRLQQAGFKYFSITSVPHKDRLRWNLDWIVLEARK